MPSPPALIGPQPLPPPQAPLVDSDGVVSVQWFRFFYSLWSRTGQSPGTDAAAQSDTLQGQEAIGALDVDFPPEAAEEGAAPASFLLDHPAETPAEAGEPSLWLDPPPPSPSPWLFALEPPVEPLDAASLFLLSLEGAPA